MTAMAAEKGPVVYRGCLQHRRPWAGTFKEDKIAFLGGLMMQVDGVARPVLSGASMDALATAVGTGNAGLLVTARRKGVKLAIVDPAGNDQAAYTEVTHSTIFTVVSVYVATDGAGAITSTAKQVQNMLRENAEAARLLRVKLAGTGASAMVAAAAASMVAIEVLGHSVYSIDGTGDADLALEDDVTFVVAEPGGGTGLLADGSPPTEGGEAFLLDDQTCSAAQASELDLRAPCTGLATQQGGSATFYCIDLARAS